MRLSFTKRDLQELEKLEAKNFSDSPAKKYLRPIKELVAENEEMYFQVYEKWQQRDYFQATHRGSKDTREFLSDKIDRAVQNKEQDNLSPRTDDAQERSSLKVGELIPGR